MQATPSQIEALLAMQEIDRNCARAELELKNLPHKDLILQGRAKRKAIQAMHEDASGVLLSEKQALARIDAEDEKLIGKQETTQTAINEASGDYRRVSQLTRDLEGARKRRETLSYQREKVKARFDEAERLVTTAKNALKALDEREAKLVEECNQRTDLLSQEVKIGIQRRQELASQIDQVVLDAYNDAVKRCKGVGIGFLKGSSCSSCRHELDADRLLKVKLDAPLAVCPSCKRLLIIPENE